MPCLHHRTCLFLFTLLLFPLYLFSSFVFAGEWNIKTIDSGRSFSSPSLHMAAGGAEWVAYAGGGTLHGGDCLFAAYRPSGGPWQSQAIDCSANASFFQAPSLDLDSSGNPHVCYVDSNGGNIKYAAYNGSQWDVSTIATSSLVSLCSLAMASDDTPSVAFTTSTIIDEDMFITTPNLLLAKKTGSVWQIENIALTNDNYIQSLSLKLTSTNLSIVAYHTSVVGIGRGFELYVARYTGSEWQTVIVDTASSGYSTQGVSLALTDLDLPIVSYYDPGSEDLEMAWYDGSGWQSMKVDETGDVGQSSSLKIYGGDRPVIAYFDADNHNIKTATFYADLFLGEYNNWNIDTFVAGGGAGPPLSLVLEVGNVPRLAYYDTLTGTLAHRYNNGMVWTKDIIDQSSDLGLGSSVVLDKNQRPHASYFDAAGNTLKYAYWDGNGWQIETIADVGMAGYYYDSSLQLDSQEMPRVMYHDPESGHLLYAIRQPSGSWDTTTLVAALTSGVSLVIDSEDKSHYIFRRDSDSAIRYQFLVGVLPLGQTITVARGPFSELTLDASDQPALSYFDPAIDQVIYFDRGPSGWRHTVVAEFDSSIASISLARDRIDRPHLVIGQNASISPSIANRLLYTTRSDSTWSPATVIVEGVNNCKLAIDHRNRPAIFYTSLTQSGLAGQMFLNFMRKDATWHNTVLADSTFSASTYRNLIYKWVYLQFNPSMALDRKGCPHITFPSFDGKGDFQYTHGSVCTPSPWPLFIPATTAGARRHSAQQ